MDAEREPTQAEREPSQADAPASSDMEGERDREDPVPKEAPALDEDEDVGGG